MPLLKPIAFAMISLSSLCLSTAFAQNTDDNTGEEPREFKSYGEYQEYVANKTAGPAAARSKHSMGLGLNYNGIGYRYTFLNERINPYFTVLIPPLVSAGLEFHSEKRPHQSVDIYVGGGLFTYLGINWKWHPDGYQNSGFELGLGLAHIPKQNTDDLWYEVEEDVTGLTWSIGLKF